MAARPPVEPPPATQWVPSMQDDPPPRQPNPALNADPVPWVPSPQPSPPTWPPPGFQSQDDGEIGRRHATLLRQNFDAQSSIVNPPLPLMEAERIAGLQPAASTNEPPSPQLTPVVTDTGGAIEIRSPVLQTFPAQEQPDHPKPFSHAGVQDGTAPLVGRVTAGLSLSGTLTLTPARRARTTIGRAMIRNRAGLIYSVRFSCARLTRGLSRLEESDLIQMKPRQKSPIMKT
jgi:hypothetical protein